MKVVPDATGRDLARGPAGFTLVELLAVIAILALLAALLLPSLNSAMDRGRQARCAANLKDIGATAFLFAADHEGLLPAISGTNTVWNIPSENPNGYSCAIELQLQAQNLERVGFTSGFDPDNSWSYKSRSWSCPADSFPRSPGSMRDTSYGPNLYAWYAGCQSRTNLFPTYTVNGLMVHPSSVAAVSRLPLSRVIMFGERGTSQSEGYVRGHDDPYALAGPFPGHNYELNYCIRLSHNNGRGLNWLFFDGHAGFDEDYLKDYATDFASLMWRNFN